MAGITRAVKTQNTTAVKELLLTNTESDIQIKEFWWGSFQVVTQLNSGSLDIKGNFTIGTLYSLYSINETEQMIISYIS